MKILFDIRHPRVGGDPEELQKPWISACAGMTKGTGLALIVIAIISSSVFAQVKTVPSFEAKTSTGEAFKFESDKIAKPTVIVFWASWCSACMNEIPLLNKLYDERKSYVNIVSISIDTDVEKVRTVSKQMDIKYPIVMDESGKLTDLFNVIQTPTLLVVDTKGVIQARGSKVGPFLSSKNSILSSSGLTRGPIPNSQKMAPRVEPEDGKVGAVTREAVLMGTNLEFVILSNDAQKANLAIDAALAEIKRIEDLMTDWRESELMQINHMAGKRPVKMNDEIIFMLEEAQKISKITKGAFDITYAGAGHLWNFAKQDAIPPKRAAIKHALRLVDYRNLVIDLKRKTAFLKKTGMKVGLGGIAKGYSVDRAVELIAAKGFENFAVKAGGDLAVRGKNNGRLWDVAIQSPRDKTKNFALLPISNGSVSTSGDSERFFIYKNKRYAHIIDPRTGYPAQRCQNVTIMAKKSYWADALATGVFILGPVEGMKVINQLPGVEGVIVDIKGRISVSNGLQKQVPQ